MKKAIYTIVYILLLPPVGMIYKIVDGWRDIKKKKPKHSIYDDPVTFKHTYPDGYKPDDKNGFNTWAKYTYEQLNS